MKSIDDITAGKWIMVLGPKKCSKRLLDVLDEDQSEYRGTMSIKGIPIKVIEISAPFIAGKSLGGQLLIIDSRVVEISYPSECYVEALKKAIEEGGNEERAIEGFEEPDL